MFYLTFILFHVECVDGYGDRCCHCLQLVLLLEWLQRRLESSDGKFYLNQFTRPSGADFCCQIETIIFICYTFLPFFHFYSKIQEHTKLQTTKSEPSNSANQIMALHTHTHTRLMALCPGLPG